MEYKVYKYTFPDGKIYIGMTHLTIQERRDCGYQHNIPLKNALKKYGWHNVKVDILEIADNRTMAFELEEKYIALSDSTNPKIGYNISKGGKATFTGLKHTESHKRHMSELYKGRTFSAETLAKIKKAHAKECKAVMCLDMNDNVVKVYESCIAAAKDFNSCPSNISRACRKINKTHKGYRWEWVKESEVMNGEKLW